MACIALPDLLAPIQRECARVPGALKGVHCLAFSLIGAFLVPSMTVAQPVPVVVLDGVITEIKIGEKILFPARPVVSYHVGRSQFSSGQKSPVELSFQTPARGQASVTVTFTNRTTDTLQLHNVVPFAPGSTDVFISGRGNHRLSRTYLHRPGMQPVNVIVPDNAWELGYASLAMKDGNQVYGLARREINSWKKATRKRFETFLHPGGSVVYTIFIEPFSGGWQEGMRKCFQERKLYDTEAFDDALYRREDLHWIRNAYVMHLMMAWDKDFYDITNGTFSWSKFQQRGKKLYGGDDVICLWPTWPTLGLDPRNQFDLYRDLPGGLPGLQILADSLRSHGTKFFVAYNPWDESTRTEGHLKGLAALIRETSADGVVLDTKGESSGELQAAADEVRPGVVMYSEGMAVPKDMQGIVSGRVHNALYYPPMLNLNKLIQPDFSIFRVAEVFKEPILREYGVAFFNGYGTEINQFAPGHPEWEAEQYRFLGRTSRILRENSPNFHGKNFHPLVTTLRDSIWVNQWPTEKKIIYTIWSTKPEGLHGPLFEITPREGFHWVDLWNHREAEVIQRGGKHFVKTDMDSFDAAYLGTNNEGTVGCLAELQSVLTATLAGDVLTMQSAEGSIRLWAGDPDYEKTPVILGTGSHTIFVAQTFGRFEGKLVVQAFSGRNLLDELELQIIPGNPRLISKVSSVPGAGSVPKGLVTIPAGSFQFETSHGDAFIPYPEVFEKEVVAFPSFYMDRFPVTNEQFKTFLTASGYVPGDISNFLKHWRNGKIIRGQERFPVVYVSYEDAAAYGRWAGKRLPTEREWQYAAQTEKRNEWPWKQSKPVRRTEQVVTETLTVTTLEGINPKNCNLGDGMPYVVGKYPAGANPFGLHDLVGSVWQLTNDIYESGSYRYIMMKGGSYFKPSSSWWYVQGGPRELHYRQYLLRVSEGFERNATVGFRCVVDRK
ncbi:MAG: SUMF1/EgtB/PvdO family nonheme iron enzyme [Cytophagales bacterium]|nr:SUMF1/EgtB/PvdO family nonheme iron enzyme [Cytophagales bacterium]